ncbi:MULTISPECIES: hypothetical protein [Bradyrhizobium]|uniref:Uncharacterized protein n=1 Tax=Bradyrhizobium ottawaense TaxID=931866 RepID=A0ABV4FT63_9BRAD|nr:MULTISPECIES: hypothetical protein [Bradyrhizobium]MBR1294830.1 hypothetical protein [Bradyrhizobium ottawaense]WLB47289.1 hypothetical protein QIH93_04235 [Bradyrhizobium ottawaense]WQN84612.1 hypothetical protein U7859_09155 [Bradyrhizobium ottawaense]BBO08501.1 hypothetical protein SG09_78510 [Bradyrhizobium ottawaense]GMO10715.1 hypothetical protein BwSH20_75310 [Bradyrhizobium ottawaense]
MPIPIPFTVFQATPGQNFRKSLFVLHAYSIEPGRALVAAKFAGETIVVAVALRKGRGEVKCSGPDAKRAAL